MEDHSSYNEAAKKVLRNPVESANYLLAAAEDSEEAFVKALSRINNAQIEKGLDKANG